MQCSKKSLTPLMGLTVLAMTLLFGCSSVRESSISQGQRFQKPSRARYILWENCHPDKCEFLDAFAPGQRGTPQILPAGQRCAGLTCDKLEEYGPNANRQRRQPRYLLGERCVGEECEEYEAYGPTPNRPPRKHAFPNKCRGKQCSNLNQYGPEKSILDSIHHQ